MRILLMCKKTIPFERSAIMFLSSNLKSKGHQVKAIVFKSGKLNKEKSFPKQIISSAGKDKPEHIISENLMKGFLVLNQSNNEGKENFNHIRKVVSDFQPHVIGYSVMTGEHYEALEINKELKKDFNFISVLGGPHPTFNKEVIEEDGLDAICTGEGDISFPEFIRRINSGEDYWLTETFYAKYKGKIYRNPKGKLVPD